MGTYLVYHINEGLGGFSGEVIGQPGLVTACNDRLDLCNNLIREEGVTGFVATDRCSDVGRPEGHQVVHWEWRGRSYHLTPRLGETIKDLPLSSESTSTRFSACCRLSGGTLFGDLWGYRDILNSASTASGISSSVENLLETMGGGLSSGGRSLSVNHSQNGWWTYPRSFGLEKAFILHRISRGEG